MDVITRDVNQFSSLTTTPCVLALGFFDGVHRGHQQVIATARRRAQALHLPLAVMTFDVHASQVISTPRSDQFRYLTTVTQKAALMARLGVARLYVIHFTRAVAAMSAQAFVDQVIAPTLAQVVVAGFDYTFGVGGQATTATLMTLSRGRFEVITVQPVTVGAWKISSTRIRDLIGAGEITAAETLLGHPLTIAVTGHGRALVPELAKQQLPPPGHYRVTAGRHRAFTLTITDANELVTSQAYAGPLTLGGWARVAGVSRASALG